jgi:fumarylacetoacetase
MTSPNYANHFSDRNVPFGIASSATHQKPQAVTRLGNFVLYLDDLSAGGIFSTIEGLPDAIFTRQTLNDFAALPKTIHNGVRGLIQGVFQADGIKGFPKGSVEDISTVTMHLPVQISDFAGKIL